jgi:hypothetical protein
MILLGRVLHQYLIMGETIYRLMTCHEIVIKTEDFAFIISGRSVVAAFACVKEKAQK